MSQLTCITKHPLPEPNCDNIADGVLRVTLKETGEVVEDALLCQPCFNKGKKTPLVQPGRLLVGCLVLYLHGTGRGIMATSTLSLFDFQQDAEDRLRDAMRQGKKRVILCLPTGSGKTEIAAKIIQDAVARNSRVYFVCDRITLVDQTSKRFWNYGIMHGVAQAENTRGRLLPIQVASAQTLEKRAYWDNEDDEPPLNLAFVDECHTQRQKIQEWLLQQNCYIIGLSATPTTPGLGLFWEDVINGATTDYLLNTDNPLTGKPYLSKLVMYAASEIDMVGAPISGGEWRASAVRERGKKVIGDIVAEYIKRTNEHFGGPVPTLVFSASIQHGEDLEAAFQQAGIDARQTTHRDTREQTNALTEAFGRREFPVLISVEKMVKGFDQPIVQCIVGARPYRTSLAAMLQGMGRGMRAADGKDYCLYIDHAGNLAGWYDDIMAFWADGVDRLDTTPTKKTRKEGGERTAPVCPFCGFLIQRVDESMSICPACGYQHVKKQNYTNVNGYVAPVKGSKKTKDKAISAKPWDRDQWWTWQHLVNLSMQQKKGDEEKARKFAYAQYKNMFEEWPNRAWGFTPTDEIVDDDVRRRVKYQVIKFQKGQQKRYRS